MAQVIIQILGARLSNQLPNNEYFCVIKDLSSSDSRVTLNRPGVVPNSSTATNVTNSKTNVKISWQITEAQFSLPDPAKNPKPKIKLSVFKTLNQSNDTGNSKTKKLQRNLSLLDDKIFIGQTTINLIEFIKDWEGENFPVKKNFFDLSAKANSKLLEKISRQSGQSQGNQQNIGQVQFKIIFKNLDAGVYEKYDTAHSNGSNIASMSGPGSQVSSLEMNSMPALPAGGSDMNTTFSDASSNVGHTTTTGPPLTISTPKKKLLTVQSSGYSSNITNNTDLPTNRDLPILHSNDVSHELSRDEEINLNVDPTDFRSLSNQNLIKLIQDQNIQLKNKSEEIEKLEAYIDQLLVKVISVDPNILNGDLVASDQEARNSIRRISRKNGGGGNGSSNQVKRFFKNLSFDI